LVKEVKHLHTVHLELLPLVEVEEVLLIVVILTEEVTDMQ
jgi:hypothetical protein